MSFVLAQNYAGNMIQGNQEFQIQEKTLSQYNYQDMQQIQSQFQYNYQNQMNCSNSCSISLQEVNNEIQIEVREQKRFLGFTVNAVDKYQLNENGEIVQARHNIWSMLLNRNQLN